MTKTPDDASVVGVTDSSSPDAKSIWSWRRGAAAIGATVALTSCAKNAQQDTWKPAGSEAQKIQDLQWWVFSLAGIIGVIVIVTVLFIVVKFKDRGQPIPEQTHGNPIIEYFFIALPAAILAVIAGFTVNTVMALNDTDNADCVINVTGQQWWWEYDYSVDPADGTICGIAPTGTAAPIITSGQMVIPTGAKVVIRGTSRDVIHSFWVPRLNGKRDMVPGRVHTWNFNATEPGIYAGQCAEFCGLSHANMRMEIVALNPADFQTWVDNQLEPYQSPADKTLAKTGEATYISQCSRCHQVDGLVDDKGQPVIASPDQYVYSGAAPNLTNLMTRTDFAGATFDLLTPACRENLWKATPEEFGAVYLKGVTPECFNETELREWLRNAPGKKPMYTDPNQLEPTDGKTRGMPFLALSESQIDEIVAYLQERK